MTVHEFDVLAASLSAQELSDETQRQHLAMLTELLSDSSSGADSDTVGATAEGPADGTAATVLRPKFSRGRRAALIAGSAVVLAGAGIGTAAAFGAFSEPTDRSMSHCYTEASLDAAHNDFSLATVSGEPGDAAAYALETCGRDWANGRLQQGASSVGEAVENGRTFTVPPLAVCVLESGQVGVFPGGEDTCHQLGLPIADL